jgi:sterol desaturase/sphingolipid hydroxylase (fatty acid hydroxylase superfamily)
MSPVELWTGVGVIASAGAFIVLERRFPYNPGQGLAREGFWNDLILYCIVQSYVMGVVIGRVVQWIDASTGEISRLHLVSGWSIGAQLACFLVIHDLYIYLFHRWQHRSPLLWRLHEAHHSVKNVDWLSGVRSHALEILINQTVEFLPLVVLGASPTVIVLKGAVSAVWGMFIHSNLDIRMGRLQYVVNGPEMHRWHHADDLRVHDRNFSTKLAIWDWLFGTAFLPDPGQEKAQRYGLADVDYPEAFPAGYFMQQAIPFLPRHAAPSAAPAETVPE